MKKIIILTFGLISMFFVGCKNTDISTTSGYKIGSSAGLATGYFVKLSNVDNKTKEIIINFTSNLTYFIPENNQTFTDFWLPIISDKLNTYIEDKTLTNDQKIFINNIFVIIFDAIDHLFVKNQKLKESNDILISTLNGFCDAFNSVICPARTIITDLTYDVDSEMYMYLKSKFDN